MRAPVPSADTAAPAEVDGEASAFIVLLPNLNEAIRDLVLFLRKHSRKQMLE